MPFVYATTAVVLAVVAMEVAGADLDGEAAAEEGVDAAAEERVDAEEEEETHGIGWR